MPVHCARCRGGRRSGFALLLVVVILSALVLIGVPFSISMRLHELSARNQLAKAHARLAALGARNHAIACLKRTFNCPLQPPIKDSDGKDQDNLDRYPRCLDESGSPLVYPEDIDLPSEFEVDFAYNNVDQRLAISAERGGLLWAATVEDEQGKINLNSANELLLTNLFDCMHIGTQANEPTPQVLAQRVIALRQANGPFNTVAQVVRDLQRELDKSGIDITRPLADLPHYATVWSSREHPALPHPININTAPALVLRAVLMGVRSKIIAPRFIPKGQVGPGGMSHVEMIVDAPPEADWTITCTDVTNGMFSFTASAVGATVNQNNPAFPPGNDMLMLLKSNSTEEVWGRAKIYAGSGGFQKDDRFEFTTRSLGWRLETETESVLDRLIQRLRAEQAIQQDFTIGGDGTGTATVTDAKLFHSGEWVEVRGLRGDGQVPVGEEDRVFRAVMRCDVVDPANNTINVELASEKSWTFRKSEAKVRPVVIGLGDGDSELGGFLRRAGAQEEQVRAIVMNACKPTSELLNRSTTGLCTKSYDVYTIDATGIALDAGGSEAGRHRIREVISLQPSHTEDLAWTLCAEYDGEKFLRKPDTSSGVTGGGAEITPDQAPSIARGSLAVRPSDGRLPGGDETRFALHYDHRVTSAMRSDSSKTNDDGDRLNFGMPPLPFSFGQNPGNAAAYLTQNGRFSRYAQGSLTSSSTGVVQMVQMWFRFVQPPATAQYLFDTVRIEESGGAPPRQGHTLQNRISVLYSPESGGLLVFQIADRSLPEPPAVDARAAMVKAPWSADTNKWHHLMIEWNGIHYSEMAMFLDGRKIGTYDPLGVIGGDNVCVQGPVLIQSDSKPRNTMPYTPDPSDVTEVWGYVAKLHKTSNLGDILSPDDLSLWGGFPLAGELSASGSTLLARPNVAPEDPYPEGYTQQGMTSTASVVLVEDAAALPPRGYARIVSNPVGDTNGDGSVNVADVLVIQNNMGKQGNAINPLSADVNHDGVVNVADRLLVQNNIRAAQNNPQAGSPNDEVIYYTGIDTASVPPRLTGVTRGPLVIGSENALPGTEWTTNPAPDVHTYGARIYGISVEVAAPPDNTWHYPAVERDWFGWYNYRQVIGNAPTLATGHNYAAIDDEWIRYTHRQRNETDGRWFLIDKDHGASGNQCMRGGQGTAISRHVANAPVYCVYEVDGDAHAGKGDVVTIVDDSGVGTQMTIKNGSWEGSYRGYVSFDSVLPSNTLVSRNARLVKFPSNEFNLPETMTVGADAVSGSVAQVEIDDLVYNVSSCRSPRTGTPLPAGGQFDVPLYHAARLFEWGDDPWRFEGTLEDLPTEGYALVDNEVVYYRSLCHTPKDTTERSYGLLGHHSTLVFTAQGDTIDAGAPTSFTVHDIDPIAWGLDPDGGYLYVSSATKAHRDLVAGGEIPVWYADMLLRMGMIKQDEHDRIVKPDGTASLDDIPASDYAAWQSEVMHYTKITPATAASYKFDVDQRGLWGSTAAAHAYCEYTDSAGGLQKQFPRLHAIAMARVIGRGMMATQSAPHARGALFMPLPWPISSIITRAEKKNGELDRIYLTDAVGFPPTGYVSVADVGNREIIGYAGIARDAKGVYLHGCRNYRQRFTSTKINLDNLAAIDPDKQASYLNADTRRIATVFWPKYHDRYPTDSADKLAWQDPQIAPSAQGYYYASRTVPGAVWKSVNWTMLNANEQADVLVRVGGKPEWGVPVDGGGSRIYHCDDPAGVNVLNGDVGVAGDTIEIRVYFKNMSDVSGVSANWQRPTLKSITVKYRADSLVLNHEEMEY